MTPRIYLDWAGDAKAPTGVDIVELETEFFRKAFSHQAILIRGQSLCRWAEIYYKGRGIDVCYLRSPSRVLSELCPSLEPTQSHKLSCELENLLSAESPPTVADLVEYLLPEGWWHNAPSVDFAARWISWLVSNEPDIMYLPLLKELIRQKKADFPQPEAEALDAFDREAASNCLGRWLGLGEWPGSTNYPLELTNEAKIILMDKLRPRAQEQQGHLCFELINRNANRQLLFLAAEADALYLKSNTAEISREILSRIRPWLLPNTIRELEAILPLAPPGDVPQEGSLLEKWFLKEYLPYRQHVADDDPVALKAGRSFAEIYLKIYQKALMGGVDKDYLSWNLSSKLAGQNNVTLLIVLDGLDYLNMEYVWGELKKLDTTGRLTLESKEVAFAPLPTITEIAKPALFKGVKPDSAVKTQPDLGIVCKRKKEVSDALSLGQQKNLVIWSILEPDKSFHHSHEHEDARPDAESILTNVARKISDVVFGVPASVALRIVITTDHGRLFAESRRTLPSPRGMNSKGRAAYGGMTLHKNLEIENDVAYLHRTSYGLPEDAAVILTGDSFLMEGGRTGVDAYPHGGVFPEEVMIPWWVIVRDQNLLPLHITISGRAMTGRNGTIQLSIKNPNSVSLELDRLDLNFGTVISHPINRLICEMGTHSLELPWGPWPTSQQIAKAECLLYYKHPDESPARVLAKLELISEDMYSQADGNPLEDLF